MITFLQLGNFYVNYEEIRFFEVVAEGHIHIWTRDEIHRRINIFKQGTEVTEDKVKIELSAPYYIQAELTAASFDKVRKALLTKVRGT